MGTVPVPATYTALHKHTAAELNAVRDALNWLLTTGPACSVYQTVAQAALASGVWTSALFAGEYIDTDNQHSTSTNTSRIVIGGTLGWYLVSGVFCFTASVGGTYRGARIAKNGNPVAGGAGNGPANGATPAIPTGVVLVQATAAGDYVEVQGRHDVAAGLVTSVGTDYACSLTALWVRSN